MTRVERSLQLILGTRAERAAFTPQVVLSDTAMAFASAIAEVYQVSLDDKPRVAALYTHAMEIGLALLCLSHDEPATFLVAHDGSLDAIDAMRERQGIPPLGQTEVTRDDDQG